MTFGSGAREPDRKLCRRGTHRVAAVARTLARVRPLLAAAGVTRVADVTGLDYLGIPVAMAVRPNARSLSVLQGKGLSRDAALVGAMMEAVEYCAAARPPARRLWRAPDGFARGAAILPIHWAIRRVARGARMPWLRAHDVLRGHAVMVPEELALLDHAWPRPHGHGLFQATSNGLAAGNTHGEAALHAVCELVERDAFTLFRLGGAPARARRALDLATVGDPDCRAVLERYRAGGVAVRAWDIVSDIGVPAYACVIDDYPRGRPPFLGRFAGTGCHPSARIALLRALTEAAQSRLTAIVGMRDDISPGAFAAMGWHANLSSIVFGGRDPRATRAFDEALSFDTASIAQDLAALLARVARATDVLALVDLTHPDIAIPVVRALAPELEGMHHRPGYRPGPRAQRLLAAAA